MTPLQLQTALKKRIEEILDGMQLSSQEERLKKIPVYEQHLPKKSKSQTRGPETTHYPCVIVYLDEGESGQTKVLFIVATYDHKDDNHGYKDAMNIVEKVNQDLIRNPLVDEKFQLQGEPKWRYNDQDNHPYYFAWIESDWEIPRSMRDDVEGMI